GYPGQQKYRRDRQRDRVLNDGFVSGHSAVLLSVGYSVPLTPAASLRPRLALGGRGGANDVAQQGNDRSGDEKPQRERSIDRADLRQQPHREEQAEEGKGEHAVIDEQPDEPA